MSEAPKALSARILDWPYWPIILVILSLKTLIFLFGAITFQININIPLRSFDEFLAIWNRWDAIHYLNLAKEGYATAGERFKYIIVFFPLYPWTVRFFAFLSGQLNLAAFFVSGFASVAAGLLLYRLARLDESEETSLKSVFFFFVFPTSYFLHIAYPESLFIALVLASFFAARRKYWFLAGCLGALASLTRMSGLALVPALAMEAFLDYRSERRFRWQWLFIGLVPLGLCVYLALNDYLSGNPVAFVTAYYEFWGKGIAWPWQGILASLKSYDLRPAAEGHMVVIEEMVFVILGLICTLVGFVKLRPSYSAWMALNWLFFTSTSFIQSVPRYTLILFPVFILFGRLAVKQMWFVVISSWSLLFLGLFVGRFVQNYWAF